MKEENTMMMTIMMMMKMKMMTMMRTMENPKLKKTNFPMMLGSSV